MLPDLRRFLPPAILALPLLGALAAPAPGQGSSISVEDPRALLRGAQRRAAQMKSGAWPKSCPYTLTQVDLPPSITGTGYMERIQVMTPCGYDPSGPPVPLIVAWNGWGLSAKSFFNGMSDIPDEANARGWMVVAVTGLDDKGFGSPNSQQNVEAALEWVVQNYNVDTTRIYGVGWSAGGGAIAAFAARHLDPTKPMFAAVATNAGSYDLVDTYWNDSTPGHTTQQIMEHPALFGGPPVPPTLWNYLRAESEDHDTQLLVAHEATSQMRNLLRLPILHVYSTDDPITYLIDQNQVFASYLAAKGANITTQTFSGLPDPHDWSLLPGKSTLDFFQQYTLDPDPAAYEINADREARYYWTGVAPRLGQQFASLAASADAGANRIEIAGLANVERLTLHPTAHQDRTTHFSIGLELLDAGVTTLVVEGVPAEPTYLLDHTAKYFDNLWHWDAQSTTLTVDLWGPFVHEIQVRFDDYSATLAGPSSVPVGGLADLDLEGHERFKPYLLLLGTAQDVFPLSSIDPLDDRNVLVALNPLPVFAFGQLDAAARASVCFGVPPTLAGQKIFCQFVTLPGAQTTIAEVSNRLDIQVP